MIRDRGRAVALPRASLLLALAAGVLSSLAGCQDVAEVKAGKGLESERRQLGARTFANHCAGCHGADGGGDGPAAAMLDPRPRDLKRAVFKFRTTPVGYLPTDADLGRTLLHGVHSTSMPSWRSLGEPERAALVEHIKTLSERWSDPDEHHAPLPMPPAPETVGADDSIRRGASVYSRMQCAKCHGADGSGKDAVISDLTDSTGAPIKPLDFSRRTPKGGAAPGDYYRAFTTGLDGTPMPSYGAGVLTDEERWDLVSFVMALRRFEGKLPPELASGATGGATP